MDQKWKCPVCGVVELIRGKFLFHICKSDIWDGVSNMDFSPIPISTIVQDNPHAKEGKIELVLIEDYGPETVGPHVFTKFARYKLNSAGQIAEYVYDSKSDKWFLGIN